MGLLQAIAEFFELLFNKNSPEIQKKIQLKKREKELSAIEPAIFKNGKLLPNFAEALRILYINTKPLNDLMLSTIAGPDVPRNRRYEAQLVMTGFTIENQRAVEGLSYEGRKAQLDNTAMTTSQIFDLQHRTMEKILHELGNQTFARIDRDLNTLRQLADLAKFNFITILQIFDSNFISADLNYKPSFQDTSVEKLLNALEDLFYVINGLNITNSTLNGVKALWSLKNGDRDISALNEPPLSDNLKKIAYVLRHIVTSNNLRLLIQYGKADFSYEPKSARYEDSARKHFMEMIQSKFKSDEQRIKTEMKDEKINDELSNLFGPVTLLSLKGYNSTTNERLLQNSQMTFSWIMPMQILKTFLSVFFTEPIRILLNNIVIEGFFNNSQYKTEFAADVYAALETSTNLEDFENSFSSGKPNDVAMIDGYLRDGHNDPEFYKKLETMITNINSQASKLISREINSLNKLSKHIEGLITDSKKPTSEIISNLKVLMFSSRNKENTDILERQFPKWEIFFEIMKNYAIISG